MGWEVKLIEFLQHDFFNAVMLLVTLFGDELFFLLVIATLYWCVDKRLGYKFFNVYILSTAVVTGLKVLIKRPRPFLTHPDRVESIGVRETSYSFPSGHSHSIANLSTQIAINAKIKRRLAIVVGSILTFSVMFTRLYLGQHYLTDVLAGAAIGIGLAFLFSYLFDKLKNKEEWLFLVWAPLCVLLTLILSLLKVEDADLFKVLGAFLAFSLGYFFEKRYVRFNPKSDKKWKQVVKFVVGIAVVLLLKEVLKLFLPNNILLIHDFLRYFLVAAWASIGAPAVFRLCKL